MLSILNYTKTFNPSFIQSIRALTSVIFFIIAAIAHQPFAFADSYQDMPPHRHPPHMQMEHEQRSNDSLQPKQPIEWKNLSAKSKNILHSLNDNWELIPINIQHFLHRISSNWDHIPPHRQDKILNKIEKMSKMSEEQLKVLEQRHQHMKGLDPQQRKKLMQQRRKFSDLKHEERMHLKRRWSNLSDEDKKHIRNRRHAMRSICDSISKVENLKLKPSDLSMENISPQLKTTLTDIINSDDSIPHQLWHKFMRTLDDWENAPKHKKERVMHFINKCVKR